MANRIRTQELEFEQWEAVVDEEVQDKLGVSMYDLPDSLTRDMYDDGLSPMEAALLIIDEQEID